MEVNVLEKWRKCRNSNLILISSFIECRHNTSGDLVGNHRESDVVLLSWAKVDMVVSLENLGRSKTLACV